MAHAKAGASLTVPNVQELAQTWNGSGERVPDRYVRTEEAAAEEVVAGCAIPVVDLSRLLDPRSSDEELANLGARQPRVPDEVIQDVRRDITEFFNLPLEAKKAHAQAPGGIEGYGQAFIFSEAQKLDWADMIYLMISPREERDQRFWPPSFAGSVDRYAAETARVAALLLRSMAVDLGVAPERLLDEASRGLPQSMRTTYYPPCRQAGDVLGLSPHTDATGLTLLLHVKDVQGLQIRKDGRWLAVDPPDKGRISAAMFHQPCPRHDNRPLPELVKKGSSRARYKSMKYMDFMKSFFAAKLDGRRSHMDALRI